MSATPKKVTKKAKVASAHPPVAQMVNAAIKALKERKGSSLAAIKKYINANYKADSAKLAPFIRRYLKKAVETGKLNQIKGSYKLNKAEKAEKKPAAKKTKKPAAKKTATKKPAAKKVKKVKTPKKAAKKPAKKPAAKPKKAKTPKKKPAAKKTAKK